MSPRTIGRPHVVIVGAGFGGVELAKRLKRGAVRVSLIDKRNHHTFQPLLYQVATAGLDADDICYATRGIFHRQENARALMAEVTSVDFASKQLTLDGDPSSTMSYDTLVLALGAETADFGVSGVVEHAFGLKSAAEAMTIRSHVLRGFETAAKTEDRREQAALSTVVIVGGGPTGVEMAGGFAELFDRVLRDDFPELATVEPKVVLVEGQDRLLSMFAPKLSEKAEARLSTMGVELRLSTQVESVSEESVRLSDGDELAAHTVVWAAGVKANPLGELLGLETARGGRIVVDGNLQVADVEDVYVIGDLAAAEMSDGSLVPQVAPAAVQQAQHVAKVLLQKSSDDFVYKDKGSMATIGRNSAVVQLPSGAAMSGFAGWVSWLALHLLMLIGFRNRLNVLVNWAWNYLTYDRASRLILDE